VFALENTFPLPTRFIQRL